MRVTHVVETDVAGTVTIRELTVAEVREWMAGLASAAEKPVDVIGAVMFEDGDLADLPLFVEGEFDADRLTQSEIRECFAKAKAINPDFFRLRSKLLMAGAAASAPSQPSPS